MILTTCKHVLNVNDHCFLMISAPQDDERSYFNVHLNGTTDSIFLRQCSFANVLVMSWLCLYSNSCLTCLLQIQANKAKGSFKSVDNKA